MEAEKCYNRTLECFDDIPTPLITKIEFRGRVNKFIPYFSGPL
jgi:hypothetical protein